MVQGQIQLNGYSIKDYEGKPLLILLTNEIFRNSIYEELLDVQISVIAEDVNENVIFAQMRLSSLVQWHNLWTISRMYTSDIHKRQ